MTGFGEELRRLLAERGMSLREAARQAPCDCGYLSKVARGQRRISPDLAGRLDDVLGARGTLAALAPERARPPAVAVPDDEEDVRRRTLLSLGLTGAAAMAGAPGALEILRQHTDIALSQDTTSRDAGEWERTAAELAGEVGHLPPRQVLPGLLADLREAGARLAGARDDGTRRRMARVCAQLAALTAITLCDLGDPDAGRYWRTAVRAADQARDLALQSLLRGRRAVFALYGRHPSSALGMAEEALAVGGPPGAGVVSAHAAQAQALARLGRHGEARDALADLEDSFTLLPVAVTADRRGQWGWAEARLRHVQSEVHSRAGRLDDACAAQDAALVLYPDHSAQGAVQVELHRAMCLITAGDPAEGARHAVRALRGFHAGLLTPGGLVHQTAVSALSVVPPGAWRLPAVQEARQMLALPVGKS
jgi:transcriptional regulator with XRE-family HTH domain